MRLRRLVLISVCLVLVGSAAGPARASSYQRLFLLGADTDVMYWSVDPLDPEAGMTTITRTCGAGIVWGTSDAKACLSGVDIAAGAYIHSIFFVPATRLGQDITWSTAAPLRFHLEMELNVALPATVHFIVQKAGPQIESPAATEVAPGVWEGTIRNGSPVPSTDVIILGVRVRTRAPRLSVALSARGASYLELPSPIAATSVPEMLAASTYAPAPSSFRSDLRAFVFNDADWEVTSLDGDLTQTRALGKEVTRQTAFVYAWVELFGTPFLDDVLRGRPLDPRKLQDAPHLSLLLDGKEIEHGGNEEGEPGRGGDALAALGVPPGTLTLEVSPSDSGETHPYTAYMLIVYGERTLSRMRWSFLLNEHPYLWAQRTPVVAVCPASLEVIPATREVTTFSVDLDWTSASAFAQKWTLRYSLPGVGFFPCAELANGDRMRFVPPGAQVWYMGATPARDATFVSTRDTVFEMEVTYAYTPAP